MGLLLSFSALIVSTIFLQLGNGAIAPLDALAGINASFSGTEIGLLGSAHFLGFLLGCWITPILMGQIGHIRTFTVLVSIGVIGCLLHPIIVDPYFWSCLRIGNGITIAGCFTVIEAWLNSKVDRQSRGSVFGVYRLADLGSQMIAQFMIGFLDPSSFVSYNLIAVFFCLCLFPLTLTTRVVPEIPKSPRLRVISSFRLSPLAFSAVVVAGLTGSSIRMVAPVYGNEIGLIKEEIAILMTVFLFGGLIAQIPIGRLADLFDRRWVLIILSLFAATISIILSVIASQYVLYIYLCSFLFGFATFPIFSVAAAHANDFAEQDKYVDIAASLIFIFGLGAIISPLFSSALIDYFGPASLFIFLSVVHILLSIIGGIRMMARPSVAEKTPYMYLPRTSLIFGKFLNPSKKESDDN